MMTRNHIACILFLVLCLSTGCKKLIEVNPPDDWLDSETIFSNDAQATAAVMGLYSTIMGQTKYVFNGGMSLFAGLSADELSRTSNLNVEDQFSANSLVSTNSIVNNSFWKPAYLYLYQCNAIIEGLHNSQSVSVAISNRLAGEVKFIRALCYYYLTQLFGAVPLVLNTKAEENLGLARESIDKVYVQIVKDLHDALNALPPTIENTRCNKMACYALLARVHLSRKEWADAEQTASMVIQSSNYELVLDLSRVFLFNSREIIFQMAPVIKFLNSSEGNTFVPVSQQARPNYIITKELLAAFETGDLRKNVWLSTVQPTGSTISYTFPYKYKVTASDTATEFNVLFRLAELYLIRAEARLEQFNVKSAVDDINAIRTRAGLKEIVPTIGKEEGISALKQERRVELFAEWGHRWIDLKRWESADSVLKIVKQSNWQSTDQLYPIPASEIEKHSQLRQNVGY